MYACSGIELKPTWSHDVGEKGGKCMYNLLQVILTEVAPVTNTNGEARPVGARRKERGKINKQGEKSTSKVNY